MIACVRRRCVMWRADRELCEEPGKSRGQDFAKAKT